MPGLVPGIHVLSQAHREDVDGRDKPGHDAEAWERLMALRLSLSVCDYDRTRAIFDGRAPIEGCDVTAVNLEPEESFHRAFKFAEFDVSEISMSSYTMTT